MRLCHHRHHNGIDTLGDSLQAHSLQPCCVLQRSLPVMSVYVHCPATTARFRMWHLDVQHGSPSCCPAPARQPASDSCLHPLRCLVAPEQLARLPPSPAGLQPHAGCSLLRVPGVIYLGQMLSSQQLGTYRNVTGTPVGLQPHSGRPLHRVPACPVRRADNEVPETMLVVCTDAAAGGQSPREFTQCSAASACGKLDSSTRLPVCLKGCTLPATGAWPQARQQ